MVNGPRMKSNLFTTRQMDSHHKNPRFRRTSERTYHRSAEKSLNACFHKQAVSHEYQTKLLHLHQSYAMIAQLNNNRMEFPSSKHQTKQQIQTGASSENGTSPSQLPISHKPCLEPSSSPL